jgi:hypothetical protein
MAQKLLNSDLSELIGKLKLAQQYVMTRYLDSHKKNSILIRIRFNLTNRIVKKFSDGHLCLKNIDVMFL